MEDGKEGRPSVGDKSQAEDAKEETVEKPDQQLNEEEEDDKKWVLTVERVWRNLSRVPLKTA